MFGQPVLSRVFIGRREELAALDVARHALAQSRGSAVLIGGEAGIGKSRLLAQFVSGARSGRSRHVVTAECLESTQQPFGPIRSFITALARSTSQADVSPHVRRALAQVTPFEFADGPAVASAETIEKTELFAALVEFLKLVAAKRATILTIEDIHWADRSTLDFLEYAVPRLARSRVMVVATFRSDELESNAALFNAMSRLVREASARYFVLESFSNVEIRELIDYTLEGRAPLPAAVRLDIEVRSEGNPFFAEELVKSALAVRKTSAAAGLPLSIRASILQRMAVLSAEDRRILARAAVLGYRFDPGVLALVMSCDVDAVLPTLRRALDLNVIVEESEGQVGFRFRHALTRQTIYDDMLAFDARRLHEQILEALERDGIERHLNALAYHAWEAKNVAKTLDYNERAGEAALAQRALAEAVACFERARDVATDELDVARLAHRLGAAERMQGRLAEAVEAFKEAFAIRVRHGQFDDAAVLLTGMICERSNLGEDAATDDGEAFLEQYGSQLGTTAHDELVAMIARLVAAHYNFDSTDRMLARIKDPQNLAPRTRMNYYVSLLERSFYYGDAETWRSLWAEVHDFLPQLPSSNRAISLYTIAQMATYMNANDIAERALLEAKRLEREGRSEAVHVFGEATHAAYFYQRGRLLEARASLERALQRPDIAVARHFMAQLAPLLALATGDADLVRRCCTPEVLEEVRATCDLDCSIIIANHAAWLASTGALAAARSELRFALSHVERGTVTCGTMLVTAARYLEPSAFPQILHLADAGAGRRKHAAGQAYLHMVSAIIAARSGYAAEATEMALAAAALGDELGWPMFTAEALELAGRDQEAWALYVSCRAGAAAARLGAVAPEGQPATVSALLSVREHDVARLVARGLTNKEISERLAVGHKTVEKHLASIFRKLSVSSRTQVAAFVADEDEDRESVTA